MTMKPEKNFKKEVSSVHSNELDAEMELYLSKKGMPQNNISEYLKVRNVIRNSYAKNEYSFNPFFTELIVARLGQKTGNNLSIDISYILSLFLRRVMIASVFTMLLLVMYIYISYGSISELLIINPEKLNDTKLISFILYDN
jgi:hypothetical protein